MWACEGQEDHRCRCRLFLQVAEGEVVVRSVVVGVGEENTGHHSLVVAREAGDLEKSGCG